MVRFIILLSLAILALPVALKSGMLSGAAMMVVGLTVVGLAVSLYADFSRYS